MINSVDLSGRPFHFIGIGGIGMSALAQVLAGRSLPVSGSDLRLSHITQRLEQLGAHIFEEQLAQNLSFFQPGSLKAQEVTAACLEPHVLPPGHLLHRHFHFQCGISSGFRPGMSHFSSLRSAGSPHSGVSPECGGGRHPR